MPWLDTPGSDSHLQNQSMDHESDYHSSKDIGGPVIHKPTLGLLIHQMSLYHNQISLRTVTLETYDFLPLVL